MVEAVRTALLVTAAPTGHEPEDAATASVINGTSIKPQDERVIGPS
jgi:hypothetical protein